MPIVFKNEKLLFTSDGKLAMSSACCCCLDEPADVTVKVRYVLEPDILPQGTAPETASGYAESPVNSVTCVDGVNGSPHSLSGDGELTWPDEDCAPPGEVSSVSLERVISGDTDSSSGDILMDISFSARVHRKGGVTVSVWPAIAWGCEKERGVCKSGGKVWLRYASGFEYTTDDWRTSGSVSTGWDAATKEYTASPRPFTLTIPMN